MSICRLLNFYWLTEFNRICKICCKIMMLHVIICMFESMLCDNCVYRSWMSAQINTMRWARSFVIWGKGRALIRASIWSQTLTHLIYFLAAVHQPHQGVRFFTFFFNIWIIYLANWELQLMLVISIIQVAFEVCINLLPLSFRLLLLLLK